MLSSTCGRQREAAFSMKIARFAPLVIVVVGLAAAGCGGSSSKGSVPTGSVAIVNGTPISKTQFDDLLGQAQRSYKSQHRPFPKAGTTDYKTLQSQALP